jgi:hypothetical protein
MQLLTAPLRTVLPPFFFGAFLLACPLVFGQGSIRGRVVDLNGRAISQALVSVERLEGVNAAAIQEVSTDLKGEFVISNVFPGPYSVIARKEEEGYGSNSSDLYNTYPSPLVNLTDAVTDVRVPVVLGPKAAFLDGTIAEDATGEPTGATVVMWRIKEPNKSIGMSVGPHFHVLVPSGADIGVKLMSNGHETGSSMAVHFTWKPKAQRQSRLELHKTY